MERVQKNIVLTGAMGAGKTTLAPHLAKLLGFQWCDTDAMIEEEAKVPGGEIIRLHGLLAFRDLERVVVLRALSKCHRW